MRFGTKWRKVHRLKREAMQLGIIVLILGLIYLFIFLSDDRKAPVIAFTNEPVSYVPGQSTQGLLAGVTATDNRDGDITKKVIVLPSTEKISETEIRVSYQVRDSRGNLTTASRVCNLAKEEASNTDPGQKAPDSTKTTPEQTTEAVESTQDAGVKPSGADSSKPEEQTRAQEPSTEEPTQEKTTEEPATKEPTTAEPVTKEPTTAEPATEEPTTKEPSTEEPATKEPTTSEPATEEPTTAEPTTEEPTTAEPTTEAPKATGPNGETVYSIVAIFIGPQKYVGDTSAASDVLLQGVIENGKRIDLFGWECDEIGQKFTAGKNVFNIRYQGLKTQLEVEAAERPAPVNNGIPVITLKQTEVTVKKGSYFHYRNLIDQLYDDKDSRDTLVQRIRVEGWDKFSTKKVGTYVLKVSVKDTDKHNSAVTVLTVHVVN